MIVDDKFLKATKNYKTPFLAFSLKEVRNNFVNIKRDFSGIDIYYAMKCNPLPQVIETLKVLGSGFEVASLNETKQLIKQGVHASKIICLHPIKSPEFLRFLNKNQINTVAIDSYEEVDKIAKFLPNAKVLVRVAVDNAGSGWHLNKKFGIEVTEFPKILKYIGSRGLKLDGLTFHVGSQCENQANWLKALDLCSNVWVDALRAGIQMNFLSLGGGLAVKYNRPIPKQREIAKIVKNKIASSFPTKDKLTVSIEPGRAMVATSGILGTKVIGVATRGGENWAYIETGTYNGLIEAIETADRSFYPVMTDAKTKNKRVYYIGGPSCVSLDTPFEKTTLPELKTGDKMYVKNAGAYTVTCSAPFNGFPVPRVYYIDT